MTYSCLLVLLEVRLATIHPGFLLRWQRGTLIEWAVMYSFEH